jgi:hypothetical protein
MPPLWSYDEWNNVLLSYKARYGDGDAPALKNPSSLSEEEIIAERERLIQSFKNRHRRAND